MLKASGPSGHALSIGRISACVYVIEIEVKNKETPFTCIYDLARAERHIAAAQSERYIHVRNSFRYLTSNQAHKHLPFLAGGGAEAGRLSRPAI